jgi:hypothetical protein
MRRTLLTALLVLLAAPAARADDAATAKARLLGCDSAIDLEERTAAFSGDMKAVPGASRLQMKFVLQARTEADEPEWVSVAAPGFGTWYSSAPGIGRYVYTKTVENLVAPASYRTQVHFRWLSATGRTLLRARRTSRVCRQPDLRPDIVPLRLTGAGDGWEVSVQNVGRTTAYSFIVNVEADGQVYDFGHVEELAPKQTIHLQRPAPPCRPGTDLIVRVDADGAVDEADEDANVLSQACPG